MSATPQRIVVRGPNWAGDVVMATPGFRALRAAHPTAEIVLLLRAGLAPLLDGSPWFDEIVSVHGRGSDAGAIVREGLRLRARRFDLGISLPDSFSSALLLRLAGVRRIVGYRRGLRSWLLDIAVPWPPRGAPGNGVAAAARARAAPRGAPGNGVAAAARRRVLIPRERHVLGLMQAAGIPEQGTRLELFTTPAEEADATSALRTAGVPADAAIAALAPGASYGTSKLWPAAYFAEVGDALVAAGAHVVLLGAPSEAALVATVRAAMRAPAADLTAGGSLGRLKALLRRARVLVCNDAGARHVAVAFGTPAVVLFGPTALEKTNLNLERVSALFADVDCRPCYRRRCPIDHRCMMRLAPSRVIEAAAPTLAGLSPGGAS